MNKLFYVSTGLGCCLRVGRSANAVGVKVLGEVGTYNGVNFIREAEDADIRHVRAMGGHMPSHPRINEVLGEQA